jgi:hypothetical protein
VFIQVSRIRISFQEPEQFINDAPEMKFFCCDQWKSILEIKAHLVTETTFCAGAGAVGFLNAFFQDMLQQVKILLHACKLIKTNVGMGLEYLLCKTCEDQLSRRGANIL